MKKYNLYLVNLKGKTKLVRENVNLVVAYGEFRKYRNALSNNQSTAYADMVEVDSEKDIIYKKNLINKNDK